MPGKVKKQKTTIFLSAKFILLLMLVLGMEHSLAQAQSDQQTTLKTANQLIAKKKFRKAHKLLQAYHKNHTADLNSIWLDAQTQLWLNNNAKSDRLYRDALAKHPENDYLRLNYIHSLLEMGSLQKANNMLSDMESAGRDYSDQSVLRARQYYYEGNYKEASAYLKRSYRDGTNNDEANALYDELAVANAPKVSLSSGYLSDNQPISYLMSTLKAEKYFNRFLDVYLSCDEYHFSNPSTADAPIVRLGDKLYFSKAGVRIDIGGGAYKFPVKNETGFTGNLSVNKKISPQFDLALGIEQSPYVDARASVDSNISVTRYSAMLNWHKRSWLGQAAVLNGTFPGNNNVYAAYLWILAPIARFSFGQLLLGGSSSFSHSERNTYTQVNSVSEIVANYGTNPSVAGVYNPYFTPDSLFINSALLSLKLDLSKKVSININGDVGYGSAQNPYLYLDKDKAGNFIVAKGYATYYFVPYDATVSFSYHINNSWLLSAKYIYHNSYFFTSNYGSLSIEKSFLSRKKNDHAPAATSKFSGMINDIESRIKGLYSCTSADDLRRSVGRIKDQLISLRDAEQRKKNMTEVSPGSEEAYLVKERYDDLTDMINELNAVDLNDRAETGNSKQWLVNKLYDLTSISYSGNLDDL